MKNKKSKLDMNDNLKNLLKIDFKGLIVIKKV
jgi:hypothetical protein